MTLPTWKSMNTFTKQNTLSREGRGASKHEADQMIFVPSMYGLVLTAQGDLVTSKNIQIFKETIWL